MKKLTIGIDNFKKIRESGRYYIDKTLMIKDFIQLGDEVALITRPRRFGKTLNMTMLREFFDITADSRAIFDGLAIMDTEHAREINSRPVIYLSFKDCKARTAESLLFSISNVLLDQYAKYYAILKGNVDESKPCFYTFFIIYEKLLNRIATTDFLEISITTLEQTLTEFYKITPIVLIDEYDQPIISSYTNRYHDELKDFFAGLYGAALKGQDCMHQALLTGIQRVVKESIFSQLNNPSVYTVADEQYSNYFGFTERETSELLESNELALNEKVKQKYDGYVIGGNEIYNPWSVLNYARSGKLENYWVNTSTNALVRESLESANEYFYKDFDKLVKDGVAEVAADLSCSFIELRHNDSLWGLLINSGYLTIVEQTDDMFMKVRIPNGEVRSEFVKIVADRARVSSQDLQKMFRYLLRKDIDSFVSVYQELVISCTSYHDAKENAYHMLFLGMCISLKDLYKITSNIESGLGRSDIRMESLDKTRPHIVIEFKQGEGIEGLKDDALKQILDNQYYAPLQGEILCIGIAHDKKRCAVAHEMIFAKSIIELQDPVEGEKCKEITDKMVELKEKSSSMK